MENSKRIAESSDKEFIYWNEEYYKKVPNGRKFWGWGKTSKGCRKYVFWIGIKSGCDECHFN